MEEPIQSKQETTKTHNLVEIMLIFMVSRFMLIVIVCSTLSRHL